MRLLDLIEMVCDWWAAWKMDDGQRKPEDRFSWIENVKKQEERFLKTGMLCDLQWFVVEEVAHMLQGYDK